MHYLRRGGRASRSADPVPLPAACPPPIYDRRDPHTTECRAYRVVYHHGVAYRISCARTVSRFGFGRHWGHHHDVTGRTWAIADGRWT